MQERLEGLNLLNARLLKPGGLSERLKRVTDGVVEIFNADFARVWTTRPGDRCETGCMHAAAESGPHVCRVRDRCLHLIASSGRYTHLDGRAHSRVPFGCYKIGKIASAEDSKFLTNEATNDPNIHDREWARDLGLVSFAGYRLLSPEGEPIGVLALFSKRAIDADENTLLESLTNTAAHVLQTAKAEEALRVSERQYRLLVEHAAEGVLVMQDDIVQFANPKFCEILGRPPSEVVSQQGSKFAHPDDHPRLWERHQQCVRGGPVEEEYEFRALGKKGAVKWLHAHTVTIDWQGRPAALMLVTDVTESKRAEAESRESEIRFRSLVDEMPNGFSLHEIICDEDGRPCDYRFLAVNQAFEKMVGLSAGEVVGKTVLEILPQKETHWIDAFGKVALTGESTHFESFALEQQKFFDVLAYCPKRGQFAAVFTDSTERKQVEETLRLTQFCVDSVTDAAYWMGPDARFTYVNQAACDTLGYSREELLTMGVHDINPKVSPEGWPEIWRNLKRDGFLVFESRHRAKDGRIIPVEIAANYIAFGEQEYSCAFARDLTHRKQEEEERLRLSERLQQAQKFESLSTLSGGVAHHFNNLLQVIIGNAELALEDLSPEAMGRDNLEEIAGAAKRASSLSLQMLACSGRGVFSSTPLDLSKLVREMKHLLKALVAKNVTLKYNLTPGLPRILADSGQLRQLLTNLTINASEALAERGGRISISTDIAACTRDYLKQTFLDEELPEGAYACLEVSDTGCGMDEETKARIFDPFFSTKFTGRGLGLAAVLGIVRGHHGAIMVESAPGQGATFRILFPTLEEAAGAREDHRAEEPDADWKGAGTVLLVDDEPGVLDVGRRALERLGFDKLTAENGEEGVRALRENATRIRCVILDLTMPGMDGEKTHEEMRGIRPEVPVVLASGYDADRIAERFAGQDLAAFIQKPFALAKLRATLKKVLND